MERFGEMFKPALKSSCSNSVPQPLVGVDASSRHAGRSSSRRSSSRSLLMPSRSASVLDEMGRAEENGGAVAKTAAGGRFNLQSVRKSR